MFQTSNGYLLFSCAGANRFSEENTVMLINEAKVEVEYFSPQFKDNSCFKGMFLVHYKLSSVDNICGVCHRRCDLGPSLCLYTYNGNLWGNLKQCSSFLKHFAGLFSFIVFCLV